MVAEFCNSAQISLTTICSMRWSTPWNRACRTSNLSKIHLSRRFGVWLTYWDEIRGRQIGSTFENSQPHFSEKMPRLKNLMMPAVFDRWVLLLVRVAVEVMRIRMSEKNLGGSPQVPQEIFSWQLFNNGNSSLMSAHTCYHLIALGVPVSSAKHSPFSTFSPLYSYLLCIPTSSFISR